MATPTFEPAGAFIDTVKLCFVRRLVSRYFSSPGCSFQSYFWSNTGVRIGWSSMDGRVAGVTAAGGAVVLGWFDGLPGEEVRAQPASTAKANRVTPQRMGRPPVEDIGVIRLFIR